MLLRNALGETLRDARTRQNRTLRDVSTAANVSLGYLSEVERGRKEASSELLASICDALDLELADLLDTVSRTMRTEWCRASRREEQRHHQLGQGRAGQLEPSAVRQHGEHQDRPDAADRACPTARPGQARPSADVRRSSATCSVRSWCAPSAASAAMAASAAVDRHEQVVVVEAGDHVARRCRPRSAPWPPPRSDRPRRDADCTVSVIQRAAEGARPARGVGLGGRQHQRCVPPPPAPSPPGASRPAPWPGRDVQNTNSPSCSSGAQRGQQQPARSRIGPRRS